MGVIVLVVALKALTKKKPKTVQDGGGIYDKQAGDSTL